MADQLVLGDPTAPRFVYWDRKLRPTPSGPDALTFDLMSIGGKIRAGLGALGFKAPMPGACWRLPHPFRCCLRAGQPSPTLGPCQRRSGASRAAVAWLWWWKAPPMPAHAGPSAAYRVLPATRCCRARGERGGVCAAQPGR